jgi:aryl-alcohol dehydrogenase-like predicted oxidoreductase
MALSILKEHGKEVHTRSVFLQGLFFKDREALGKLSPLKESLLKLDILSDSVPTDIGTLALGYTLHQYCIDRILIGIETEKQLQDNVQMLSNVEKIPTEIYNAIDHVVVENSSLLIPTNW